MKLEFLMILFCKFKFRKVKLLIPNICAHIFVFYLGILPMVTPKQLSNLINVPKQVEIPEVCCVMLSQQTKFVIKNLHDRGIKCVIAIRDVKIVASGQQFQVNHCPFDVKSPVILEPNSSESIQVSLLLFFLNKKNIKLIRT